MIRARGVVRYTLPAFDTDLGTDRAALGLLLDLRERINHHANAAAPAIGRHRPWT